MSDESAEKPVNPFRARSFVTRTPQRRKPKRQYRKRVVSQEQLDQFEGNRMVRIILADKHTINGMPYGPGEVHVSRKLARVLMDQDQRSVVEEQRFRGGSRAFVVGPSRGPQRSFGASEVHPDYFESAVNNGPPALTNPHHQGV